jgi:hypothetical protein
MTQIEQELTMLKSGKLGKNLNLPELVSLEIISQEAANIYIKDLYKEAINSKEGYAELSRAISAIV